MVEAVREPVGPVDEVVDRLECAIGQLNDEVLWRLDDDRLLGRLDRLGVLIGRMTGERLRIIHEADRRQVCEREHGWSVANRVVASEPQPLRQARAAVALAGRLHRFGLVEQALCDGTVSVGQADAITRALSELPDDLSVERECQAQDEMMVQARAGFDPAGLRRIGNRLVEVIDPDAADDVLGRQLERQERRARRDRFLAWATTGDGSLDIRARLPITDGEAFVAVIDAHANAARGLDQQLDPETQAPTLTQRRADALCRLVEAHQHAALAPDQAGDRPRVAVLLDYQDLVAGVRGATLLGTGDPVSPGEARRLACDAEIIPTVLGHDSALLDVGRTDRLFTGPLRHALVVRDRGCAFPGCDAPPAHCEAHHIRPWWNHGETKISNGVLLCRHHHRIIEPDPRAPANTRWTIRLNEHGLPEAIPPARLDPTRQPRQHVRYRERGLHRRT